MHLEEVHQVLVEEEKEKLRHEANSRKNND